MSPNFSVAFGLTLPANVAFGLTLNLSGAAGTFHGAPLGAKGEASGVLPLFGLFADWFPNPRGGWHVGGAFGIAGYQFTDSAGRDYGDVVPGVELFAGHDTWIGPQYSLGASLVVGASPSSKAKDLNDVDTYYRFADAYVGLRWSLLWH